MEDWKKRIEDSAQNVEVPDSLQPEQLEKRLEQQRKRVPLYRRTAVLMGTAAAVVVLGIAGVWGAADLWKGSMTSSMNTEAALDTVTETTVSKESEAAGSQADSGENPADTKGTYKEGEADKANKAGIADKTDHGTVGSGEEESAEEDQADKSYVRYYHRATYEELKEMVKKAWDEQQDKLESVREAADTGTGTTEDESSHSNDYSTTNLQVEGVDEGDIVKTDGTYLYILSSDSLVRIVEAKSLKKVAEISAEETDGSINYQEMYVSDGKLILVGNCYESGLEEYAEDVYYMDSSNQTVMVTYDLSDVKKPKLEGKISQDGYYHTSRKVGDVIYLFSDYYCPLEEDMQEDQLIPRVNDRAVAEDQIYVPNSILQCRYMVISSVNLNNPDQIVDEKALMNSGEQFYITKSSIYVIQYEWDQMDGEIHTNIIRFRMDKGEIIAKAAASLKGELTDTFAINEYGKTLRVLLTDWSGANGPTNRVYVLDDKMVIQGKIENLAEGETIYSARFMGNTGYFVTYRNMDPLFSVDFTDMEHPRILGELKVTGFSDYLHFYGEGQLLGLGWETDPDTGETKGLKLSMYDIRDPENVAESKKLVIKGIDDCEAMYNYKAVLINEEKNLIGFTVGTYKQEGYWEKYVVFSYDSREGFKKKMEFELGNKGQYYSNGNVRGLYIGDDFYVTEEQKITVFDMKNDFEKTGSLELAEER